MYLGIPIACSEDDEPDFNTVSDKGNCHLFFKNVKSSTTHKKTLKL